VGQVRGYAPIGMLEFWNIGMVDLENQNDYNPGFAALLLFFI
jgi:hypothetical protein